MAIHAQVFDFLVACRGVAMYVVVTTACRGLSTAVHGSTPHFPWRTAAPLPWQAPRHDTGSFARAPRKPHATPWQATLHGTVSHGNFHGNLHGNTRGDSHGDSNGKSHGNPHVTPRGDCHGDSRGKAHAPWQAPRQPPRQAAASATASHGKVHGKLHGKPLQGPRQPPRQAPQRTTANPISSNVKHNLTPRRQVLQPSMMRLPQSKVQSLGAMQNGVVVHDLIVDAMNGRATAKNRTCWDVGPAIIVD